MLSYGCSPSCVNGVADEAVFNFSAEFMQTVISLSLADETRDETTARGVWAAAFTRLNRAANAFRATPSWEPPHVLAQVIKMDAIEQRVGDDEQPATASKSSDGQPAPDETIGAAVNSGAAPPLLYEESHSAGSSTASRLGPGSSISPPHSSQTAPHAPALPPATPHTLLGTPEDADTLGRTSPASLPTNEGAMTAISTGQNPRIVEVVLPHLLLIPRQAARNEQSTLAIPPSVPAESTGPEPKPVACDPVDPPAVSPAAQNTIISSENSPPSSSTVPAPIKRADKRVRWGSPRDVPGDSDSGSSLTEDERTETESEGPDGNESEEKFEIDKMPRPIRAKGGQSTSKAAKGKASALAATPKRKMAPAAQKRMPERRPPREFTSSCYKDCSKLLYSAAGVPHTSVSTKGPVSKQTPSTPSRLPRKRRGTELHAPDSRQAQQRGSHPMDSLKEFLEGVVPHAAPVAGTDDIADDEDIEEIAQKHPPMDSKRQTPGKLRELSLPYDEFDAKTGCFVKVSKPFGFRYRTKVTTCK
jgi:hypothetical protein